MAVDCKLEAMFASLPMYDLPQIRSSTDALWQLFRARLADHGIANVPAELTRGTDPHQDWLGKGLLFSQTCGLPLVRELQGKVQMLGSPSYDIDCGSGNYYSVVIARDGVDGGLEAISGARMACNDLRSQSGFAAMLTLLQKEALPLPTEVSLSGSHLASIEMVATGAADFAAIDAVTWELARRHSPYASSVRVVTETEPMPCLPYITSLNNRQDADAMRQAVSEAIAGLSEKDRDALLLTGFVARQEADYDPIADAWVALEESGIVANVSAQAK